MLHFPIRRSLVCLMYRPVLPSLPEDSIDDQRFQDVPRNCEAVQAICIDSEEDLQPFTKRQQTGPHRCSKPFKNHICTYLSYD